MDDLGEWIWIVAFWWATYTSGKTIRGRGAELRPAYDALRGSVRRVTFRRSSTHSRPSRTHKGGTTRRSG